MAPTKSTSAPWTTAGRSKRGTAVGGGAGAGAGGGGVWRRRASGVRVSRWGPAPPPPRRRLRAGQDHDLGVGRHPHPEALLGDPADARAAGGLPDRALQRGALGDELRAPPVERLELARVRDARHAPPDHGGADEHEGDERERDDHAPARAAPRRRGAPGRAAGRRPLRLAARGHAAPPAAGAPARSHTRSLALRARGLRAVSSGPAGAARRVTTVPNGTRSHVHAGWRGGQTHAELQSRNACFTRRSSPEW
jgi:hypothetical protein